MRECRLFSDMEPRFCDGMKALLANGTMHVLWRMENKRPMAFAVMVQETSEPRRFFQAGDCPYCGLKLETCESTDEHRPSGHQPVSHK